MSEERKLTQNLTAKQKGVVLKMAEGWTLHWWSGIRSDPSAHLAGPNPKKFERERVRVDCTYKFHKLGLIESTNDRRWHWRNVDYKLTELGKRVAEDIKNWRAA